MNLLDLPYASFAVALGSGLLIGAERERHKGEGPERSTAGIRTFALVSLAGAAGETLGGGAVAAVTIAAVAALAAVGYWRARGDDPGLTTEVTLLFTVLIGAVSVRTPALAGGLAVVTAVLLATRASLHRFVRAGLTDAEARDALILAAAALVVLPLLPDKALGPFQALNPHALWGVVVLVLAIGAAGHIAVRLLGQRFGLPLAGLAVPGRLQHRHHGAMGVRSRHAPATLHGAAAGAVLSTVSTVIQLAAVIGATSLATLQAIAPSLACAGIAAAAYGAVFTALAVRRPSGPNRDAPRAFSLVGAGLFAATVAVVLVTSAALRAWFGEAGVVAGAALAGFADTHAAGISVASLVAERRMDGLAAAPAILAAFSANTISKIVLALGVGPRGFAARVVPGLVLVAAAAWAPWLLLNR